MHNILIIDQSHKTVSLLNLIVTEFTNYQTTVETKKSNIINLLDTIIFEYIVIDHIIEHSDEIIAYILNKNPKQKVILLSDHIKCPVSCEDCFNLFQFVRIIKPVKPRTILNYLNNSVILFVHIKTNLNQLIQLMHFLILLILRTIHFIRIKN